MKRNFNFKTAYLLLLSLVLLLFGGAECDKYSIPFTEYAKLPKKTTSGANTFGCLIDGKLFSSHSTWHLFGYHIPGKEAKFAYDLNTNTYYFLINIYNDQSAPSRWMHFKINSADLQEKTYQISDDSLPECFSADYYFDELNPFKTNNTNAVGQLNITHFDPVNKIVSGTFWFDAVNGLGETIQVREGRFDLLFE